MTMGQALMALIIFVVGAGWWQGARAAHDRARELGGNACRAAGVQWLDDTVQAAGLSLARDPSDGWLKIRRRYRFEYSRDGQERQTGSMALLGTRLVAFDGPVRDDPVRDFPAPTSPL